MLDPGAGSPVTAVADLPVPDSVATNAYAPGREYLIGAMDVLTVTVVGQPDLTAEEVQVDSGGFLSLPLVGSVRAAGRSPAQLVQDLETAYRRTYLRHPRVGVVVKQIRSQYVTVEGQVTQSGVFPIPGRITLTGAVALARGTTAAASTDQVAVFRTVDGQRMAAIFNMTDIRRGRYADPDIYAGDTVVVGGDRVRRIFQDVVSVLPFLTVFRPF